MSSAGFKAKHQHVFATLLFVPFIVLSNSLADKTALQISVEAVKAV